MSEIQNKKKRGFEGSGFRSFGISGFREFWSFGSFGVLFCVRFRNKIFFFPVRTKKKLGKNKNRKKNSEKTKTQKKKRETPKLHKTSQNFPKLPETSLPPKKTNSGKRIRESEFGKQRTKKKEKGGTENGVADTSGSDEESAGRKRKFYRD
jgi:hypothetical protein